jgi:hypothetical protein
MKKLLFSAVIVLGSTAALSTFAKAKNIKLTASTATSISDKRDVGSADLNDKRDVGSADLNDKRDVGSAD